MIALSPPASPASRFESLGGVMQQHGTSTITTTTTSTGQGHAHSASGSSTPVYTSSASSSPRSAHARLVQGMVSATGPSAGTAATTTTSSAREQQQQQLPKPAQLQRLHNLSSAHAHSLSSSSSSTPSSPTLADHSNSQERLLSPLFAPGHGQSAHPYSPSSSPSLQYSVPVLPLRDPSAQQSRASPSPKSRPLGLPRELPSSSSNYTYQTHTTPLASPSLLFSSPEQVKDVPLPSSHKSSNRPSPQYSPNHSSNPVPTSTTTTTSSASPRPHKKLSNITSPRSIVSSSSNGSSGLAGYVPPSPGPATARPPVVLHSAASSSSGSGGERQGYAHAYGYTQGQHAISAALLARSSTRSPPPLNHHSSSSSSVSNSQQHYNYTSSNTASPSHHHSSLYNHGFNGYGSHYRDNSPDSASVASSTAAASAYAYTASNTTNSFSGAFHASVQQRQAALAASLAGTGLPERNASASGNGSGSSNNGGGPPVSASSNFFLTRPVAGSSASLSASTNVSVSAASSRHPSRRPSIATLQSFLEGVNHVTRVRSPSLRGHSRSGSFDDFGSVVGGSRAASSILSLNSSRSSAADNTPWHLDDVDEVPSWEDHNRSLGIQTPNSPTPRSRTLLTGFTSAGAGNLFQQQQQQRYRDGSFGAAHQHRRDLFTPDNEYGPPSFSAGSMQSSPMPIGGAARNDPALYDDDYDEYAEKTFVDRRDMTLFPDHIRQEDEEKHLRNLDEQVVVSPDGLGESDNLDGQDDHLWSESDLNSLQEGDRLGVGLIQDGFPIVDALADIPTSGPESPRAALDDGIQFEVVRQLGFGSYAIVYLVKEVLYDPEATPDGLADGQFFPDVSRSTRRRRRDSIDAYSDVDDSASTMSASSAARRDAGVVYGREFALKCLSKRNLSEEQIAVQKLEATLHRTLPDHPNVVALHRAMETPAWLFLVLEYCPGQDLFFWLEQARDHDDIDIDPSRAPSRLSSRAPIMPPAVLRGALQHTHSATPSPPLGESPHSRSFEDKQEATPPSPSLLSANADTALLSRRRLRLISRMFVQMCEALQACHDAGVSHRDIKPENIIIVDNRAELGSGGKVVIKITDWGLGTTEERCEDFDCGSKPYMAYECRNNLMPSYEPKGADVWSLGIVLLNLLFHRCPWADPTLDDPDFCAFRCDPPGFLTSRFEGIGSEVAAFLATRVFCDIEDHDAALFSSPESVEAPLPSSVATATPFTLRHANSKIAARKSNVGVRVTAGEFAKWAAKLVRHMGEGSRRASISDATYQILPTVRQSPRIDGGSRIMHSPPARSPRNSVEYTRPNLVEASPDRRNKRLSAVNLPNDLVEELEKRDGAVQSLDEAARRLNLNGTKDHSVQEGASSALHHDGVEDVPEVDGHEPALVDGEVDGEAEKKDKSRRRKRGARKGRTQHRERGGGDVSEDARSPVRSRSGTLSQNVAVDPSESAAQPDNANINLSEASRDLQEYAREISQATKPSLLGSHSFSAGTSPVQTGFSVIAHNIPPAAVAEPNIRVPATVKSRFADKLKNAFANGNPELQAFAARAQERELAWTGGGPRNPTASAPAKMQHTTLSPSSQLSSVGSVASSTGSWSEDGNSGNHWASTGSRRDRLERHRKKHAEEGGTSISSRAKGASSSADPSARPSRSRHAYPGRDGSSTAPSSPSPSRHSFTPLSSFSSVTSYDSRPAGNSVSPVGVRAARSPLHSIDETASASSGSKDHLLRDDDSSTAATPLARSTVFDARPAKPANTSPQVIREPKAPPVDVDRPLQASVSTISTPLASAAVETQSQAAPPSTASKAKIGRFFGKFRS